MKRVHDAIKWLTSRESPNKRARLEEEIESELLDLPSEMRNLIMEDMAVRPLLRTALANKQLKGEVDRAFVTIFKRDVLLGLNKAAIDARLRPEELRDLKDYGNKLLLARNYQSFNGDEALGLAAAIIYYRHYALERTPEERSLQKLRLGQVYMHVVETLVGTFTYNILNALIRAALAARRIMEDPAAGPINRGRSDSRFEFFDPRDTRLSFAIEVRANVKTASFVDIHLDISSEAPEDFRESMRLLAATVPELEQKLAYWGDYLRDEMRGPLERAFTNIFLGGTPRLTGMWYVGGDLEGEICGLGTNLTATSYRASDS